MAPNPEKPRPPRKPGSGRPRGRPRKNPQEEEKQTRTSMPLPTSLLDTTISDGEEYRPGTGAPAGNESPAESSPGNEALPPKPAVIPPQVASSAPEKAAESGAPSPEAAPAAPAPAPASPAPAPAAKTQRRIEFATTEPAATAAAATPGQAPVVVSRASTSGGRQWGINVGRYNSQTKAERVLLQTALQEIGTLDGALRKIQRGKAGYDANFVGLSADQAELACKRIVASGAECTTFGPSGS